MSLKSESPPGPSAVCSPCPCPLTVTRYKADRAKRSHKHQPVMKRTVAEPRWSDEASSKQAEHWLHLTSPWNSRAVSLQTGWGTTVWQRTGHSGSWCVEAEPDRRQITSGLDLLFKSGRKTALENCKGTESVQLCTCSCYWGTRLSQQPLCHFNRFPESYSSDLEQYLVPPKSPLQQLPLQRAHGKEQCSHGTGETAWGSDAQNATAEVETAPRGNGEGQGESRDLVRGCASQGELFPPPSSRAGSGRAGEGQSCDIGLKISYLHYFPNGTVFNCFLLVTLDDTSKSILFYDSLGMT